MSSEEDNILEIKNVSKIYSSGIIKVSKVVGARNVNFNIKRGEILSIVGESGSGKSTVANIILRLLDASEGEIFLNGQSISSYKKKEYYGKVQAIFQDPYGSFNQFYKIDRALEEAFRFRSDIKRRSIKKKTELPRTRNSEKKTKKQRKAERVERRAQRKKQKAEKERKIHEVLQRIGLNPHEVLGRYPHQLSGGQLQRFLLARILIIEPVLLIADEMTSMIDASSRAGILNLLEQLKEYMSVLFITHDIGQAQYISDNIIVMEKGDVVEQGPVRIVLTTPKHNYTKELLKSVPTMKERWDFLQSLSKKTV